MWYHKEAVSLSQGKGKAKGKGKDIWSGGKAPKYRKPDYKMLSDVTAGRGQAGPQSTPPRAGTDLDEWQDLDHFHSPEL